MCCRRLQIEELEARIALLPLLQAEHDRRWALYSRIVLLWARQSLSQMIMFIICRRLCSSKGIRISFIGKNKVHVRAANNEVPQLFEYLCPTHAKVPPSPRRPGWEDIIWSLHSLTMVILIMTVLCPFKAHNIELKNWIWSLKLNRGVRVELNPGSMLKYSRMGGFQFKP